MKRSLDIDTSEEASGHKRPRRQTSHKDRSQGPNTGAEDSGLVRDKEFWYEDGSVVLVAGNVGFRVYRGLLVRRSEVFSDLFSVPQPQDSQLVCGCPVVHLSDTPDALREVLGVLLCGKKYIQKNDIELDRLSYRIRLAHKYGIEDLLDESIQQLRQLFPANFASWRATGRHYTSRGITAVNLARLTNTQSVLPTALYVCCQLSDRALLEGAAHPDGTTDELSRDDLLRCMAAKSLLGRTHVHGIHTLLHHIGSFVQGCRSQPSCCRAFDRMRHTATTRSLDVATPIDILDTWDDLLDKYDRTKVGGNALVSLCECCMTNLRERVFATICTRWASLPGLVDAWKDKVAEENGDPEIE
ncbi:uncharacterized protein C8Q71DRAFT_765982 [Rhodofomes roseus]|uniref:BTB domain-containing protein n=1 Tax=Rhodofomes roseus TaxID=34475 RepID=A0A4Y9YBM8_9APHY|nr:uncharacterized protein C8Q71DRAFT_765982 [Rhodofomes roseus]KAH9835461.1 hypothetical protein C8Q71DRAFT_765982 [Rhodofomes roseus]TFY59725.1 hypothetical protein EVJ58_g5607 [Rhodofomes roseus]